MAEGRARAEWSRTSSVLALIANVNRDPKAKPRPWTAADFDPFARAERRKPDEVLKLKDAKGVLMAALGAGRK